jgi:hypothetical protein
MRKLVYKILVLILLISFNVEITSPFFRDNNSFSLAVETQDTDEKKEVKDKNSSNTNFLPLIEMVTDFYLKNDLVNTLGFLSLHEMPPDQV